MELRRQVDFYGNIFLDLNPLLIVVQYLRFGLRQVQKVIVLNLFVFFIGRFCAWSNASFYCASSPFKTDLSVVERCLRERGRTYKFKPLTLPAPSLAGFLRLEAHFYFYCIFDQPARHLRVPSFENYRFHF